MANPIIEFVNSGKELTSAEGLKLLNEIEREKITEAWKIDEVLFGKLALARNVSDDVYLRRKIMLALSDAPS
ncbi:MAG: hypothetical protein A2Y82_04060 [Candidatus Buchananbacteria bacterium RBG_13_36_9]|uniref:Uncharacterized protein n=1 Tax=Candidatus Buchananbacteria bacterium RBG_13_36_9 TaxID=1797530 RepID=A0A1G1XR81_9BACT|nr:MAG: hypothetical protein A2Y82_04060 [Candidatus Buchananbacteria bacterium RBG_13_36_9]